MSRLGAGGIIGTVLGTVRDASGPALALLCLLATPAQANIFDLYGAGARATGMAGTMTALSADAMATFYNPARLAYSPDSVTVGLTGTFNRTAILLSPRPSGYDPPAYDLRLNPRADTEDPPSAVGLSVGFTLNLFSDDLTLGGVLFAPFDGFSSADAAFPDEREQYFSNRLSFELVGERANVEVIGVGLAYRPHSRVSVGIGLMVLPENQTVTQVYTPNAADPSNVDLNVRIEQSTRRALTAGVALTPIDDLEIGLSFQDEIFFRISGHSDVQLRGEEGEVPPRQDIDIISHYTPARISGGVAWLGVPDLAVSLQADWHAWSQYLDNHGALAGFDDTIDWSLGLEYTLTERGVLRAGLGWRPSPIPTQDGRTNYVDNDRVTASIGAGRAVRWMDQEVFIDVGVQLHGLLARQVDKHLDATRAACADGVRSLCDEVPDLAEDTPLVRAADTAGLQTGNPGFPGFTHGGYILAASMDLRWPF